MTACARRCSPAVGLLIMFSSVTACTSTAPQRSTASVPAAQSPYQLSPQEPRHVAPATAVPSPLATITQTALAFSDASHGWLVAAICATACMLDAAKTSDGGMNWSDPVSVASDAPSPDPSPGPPAPWLGVRFVGDDGWIFGPGIFQTHDGGRSWRKTLDGLFPTLEPYGGTVWAIRDCSPANYSVLCTPVLMQSSTRTDVWSRAALQPPLEGAPGSASLFLERAPQGVAFLSEAGVRPQAQPDGNRGPSQVLFTSRDAGRSWHRLAPPCDGIQAIRSPDGIHVWALCATPCCTGNWVKAVYFSADGGHTWGERADTDYQGQYGAMDFYGSAGPFSIPASGVALYGSSGSAGIWRSSDGGRTWHSTFLDMCIEGGEAVTELWFVTPLRGWAIAGNAVDRECPTLLRTLDGGITWTPLGYPFS